MLVEMGKRLHALEALDPEVVKNFETWVKNHFHTMIFNDSILSSASIFIH